MRIVHATSELFPYIKTGGLADAVAALTGALADRGHELAVFLPGYRTVRAGPHVAEAQSSHQFKVEVLPVPDAPIITDASTDQNNQSSTGLVISRNDNDGAEVNYFKITNIQKIIRFLFSNSQPNYFKPTRKR